MKKKKKETESCLANTKSFFAIFAMSAALLLSSCTAPLSNRMNDYVTEVETNCQNWTEADWELSQEQYAKERALSKSRRTHLLEHHACGD